MEGVDVSTKAWIVILVVVLVASTGLAGSSSNPEIDDDLNDVQGSTSEQTGADDPADDWADLNAIWFSQQNQSFLDVSIQPDALPPTDAQDVSSSVSVTYTVSFRYHSPSGGAFTDGINQTYDGALQAQPAIGGPPSQDSCTFEGNDVAVTRDSNALVCSVPVEMISVPARNGTVWDGDMLMDLAATSSQNQPQYADNASAPDTVYFFEQTLTRPADTGGGGGGGGGGDGDGNTTPPPDTPDSTPGFGIVAVAAALVGVAWAVKRRR